MAEIFNITKYYKTDHTTFGGEVTLMDFEEHCTLASMANKIAKELAFDKQCKRNIEFRKEEKEKMENV